MEALTEKEIELIFKRLEEFVADLEQDLSERNFYAFIILAQDLAGTKKELFNIEQIRKLVSLAQRMLAIRKVLLPEASRWTPLSDVLKIIESDATMLTRLYGVARPEFGKLRRDLHSQFRAYFKKETGKDYQEYGGHWKEKERRTITGFWEDYLSKALSSFKENGEAETLDSLIACLPAWADRKHERWGKHAWIEPSAKEVMQILNQYLMVCDECMGKIYQIAVSVLEQAPVVDLAQIKREVEQRNAEKVKELREKISAIQIPKEAPKEQKAKLRKEKEQLNQKLQELLRAQEQEIKSRVNKAATYRQKLETLEKKARVHRENMLQKVGKEILDVLTRIIWIYDLERSGGEDWKAAKKEARSFFRKVLKEREIEGGDYGERGARGTAKRI